MMHCANYDGALKIAVYVKSIVACFTKSIKDSFHPDINIQSNYPVSTRATDFLGMIGSNWTLEMKLASDMGCRIFSPQLSA